MAQTEIGFLYLNVAQVTAVWTALLPFETIAVSAHLFQFELFAGREEAETRAEDETIFLKSMQKIHPESSPLNLLMYASVPESTVF